jgi:hypothetical protein
MKNNMKNVWNLGLLGSLVILAACGGSVPAVEGKNNFVKPRVDRRLFRPSQGVHAGCSRHRSGFGSSVVSRVHGEPWHDHSHPRSDLVGSGVA